MRYSEFIVKKAEDLSKEFFGLDKVSENFVIGYMESTIDHLMREIEQLASPEKLDEITQRFFTE